VCCQLDFVSRVGEGIPCSGHGLFNISTLVWGASVVLIKFTVCGQTRGSGAACTAVTILGRRCVPYWEQNQASGLTVCVLNYRLGLSLHLSQTFSKLTSHESPLKMIRLVENVEREIVKVQRDGMNC
jgi:hypothetical protein